MLIHNKDELNAILLQKTKNAVIKAEGTVYNIIHRFVKEYYAEYDPVMYVRTYQFYQSLVQSEITPVEKGLGWKARVYFDLSKLNYYMKTIQRNNKRKTLRNTSDNFDDPLDEAGVLDRVMAGYHVVRPRIVQGTPIWLETQKILDEQGFEILKRMLVSEGIPIK